MDDEVELPPESPAAERSAGAVFSLPTERLQPRVVFYWYLTDLLRSVVMSSMLVGGVWYWGQKDPAPPEWTWTAAVAFATFLIGTALVAPPLAWQRWRFGVDDELLTMRYGILFLEERLVPVPRMQHVDILRGPIERLFGLATLVVYTAGNEGSAFRVPGLSRARAEQIRDGILRARGHDFT